MSPKPFAIIAGVGPGTGAAVARKFAAAYPVILLARNPANYEAVVSEINQSGGVATGIVADVSDEESVKKAFLKIEETHVKGKDGSEQGHLAAAVFNVGGGFIRKPFLELTTEEFEGGFKSNGYVSLLEPLLVTLESSNQIGVQQLDRSTSSTPLSGCHVELNPVLEQTRGLSILSFHSPPIALYRQQQAQAPTHTTIHRRHSFHPRQHPDFVLCDRQICPESTVAESREGVWAARGACGTCDH